jgi:5-methylcytosine-specific restriction protein A
LDALLSNAAARRDPLRVIVNEGEMRAEADLGRDSSVVRVRHLDSAAWRFAQYDNISGEFVLQRDAAEWGASPNHVRATVPPQERYADQHDLAGSDAPERKTTYGSALVRDTKVRTIVLERSEGHCELCDAPGFRTRDGSLYAETHHVIPLGEDGPDRVWNVVALCPNHHREAHSGAEAPAIRTQLLAMLMDMYPVSSRSSAPA